MIRVKDGAAYAYGVEYCARIWLCPMCAAKIRMRRGDEVAHGIGKLLADGGAAYFGTATLPHDQGDALGTTLELLTKCWRSTLSTKAAQGEKRRNKIMGNIKAVEITHGSNGWHPHIHCVFCLEEEISIDALSAWWAGMKSRWDRALVRNGWRPTVDLYGFNLKPVSFGSTGLAAYVTKVQEGGGLGNELARADLKKGRRQSRTPLQILWDYYTTGNAADLELWHEYELATQGKDALRWSRGLRRRLLTAEEVSLTDEDIVAEDQGGDDVVAFARHTWEKIQRTPRAQHEVYRAVESGSWERLIATLLGLGIGTEGVLTPEEYRAMEGVSER